MVVESGHCREFYVWLACKASRSQAESVAAVLLNNPLVRRCRVRITRWKYG